MAVGMRIALYQVLVGLLAGGAWWLIGEGRSAAAALAGGWAGAFLSFYAALKTFGGNRQDAQAMLRDFYRAHAWKTVFAVLIFVVAIKFLGRQHFVPFITSFMLALSVYWFSLLWKK